MGGLLIAVGLLSSLWLLNGSSNRVAFSVGVLFTGLMPLVFAYLMLAHPTGHLHVAHRAAVPVAHRRRDGDAVAARVAMTLQPPLRTPLRPVRSALPEQRVLVRLVHGGGHAVQAAMVLAWLAVTCGTGARWHAGRAPPRPRCAARSRRFGHGVGRRRPADGEHAVPRRRVARLDDARADFIGLVRDPPLAILVGLGSERLFMGQALAEFVNELAGCPRRDTGGADGGGASRPVAQGRLSPAGTDDLRGLRRRAGHDLPDDSAITWIERDHEPVAAVMYSEDLSGYEPFVQAAGAAAVIRLEKTQAEAELKASTADLASSRIRLMEMAHSERRRLERDLHDGVQQHLVGLRIKLDMAAETIREDLERGERALASVGRQMDDVLQELRLLARGIYPSLLHECGLREALSSAARSSPLAVSVRAPGIGRYPEEVEVAVYFCCLEAIQNVVKHAGPDATAMVTMSRDGPHLCFEVHDTGVGFNPEDDPSRQRAREHARSHRGGWRRGRDHRAPRTRHLCPRSRAGLVTVSAALWSLAAGQLLRRGIHATRMRACRGDTCRPPCPPAGRGRRYARTPPRERNLRCVAGSLIPVHPSCWRRRCIRRFIR